MDVLPSYDAPFPNLRGNIGTMDETTGLELAGLRFQIGIYEEALRLDPESVEALRFLGNAYTKVGRLEDGLVVDRRLAELRPQDGRVRYNLACSCALCGRKDEAFELLHQARDLGFRDGALVRSDPDLESIRDDPRFREVLARFDEAEG